MIIVDTNVASELMQPSPALAVRDWVRARDGRELFTTSITLSEIRYGIERLPDGRRKELVRTTAEDLFAAFAHQILPFDAAAAAHYAGIVSRRESIGIPIDGFDAQIASICRTCAATLATRNVEDFRDTQVDLINPWTAARPSGSG